MDILSYVIGKSAGEAAAHVDIEQLDVTENNTYTAQSGHAYSPVVVNVPQTTIEALNVTSDGTYTAPEGKAYSPISVSVSAFDLPSFLAGAMTSIESGTTALRNSAFYNYTNLLTASFPNAVTIGTDVFKNCTKLETLSIPSATSAAKEMCRECSSLHTVTAPLITTIGQYAFHNCTFLTTLNLDNITSIEDYGLYNCQRLYKNIITCNAIGQYGCYGLSSSLNTTFNYCPSGTATVGNYAFTSSKVEELVGTFNTIGIGAFSQCAYLRTVDITVNQSVNNGAFNNSTSVITLKAKLNCNLIDNAFNGLQNVSTLLIDPSSNVTEIGSQAFKSCGRQRTNPSSNPLTFDFRSSTFPVIKSETFGALTYATVYLPSTITSIQSQPFYNNQYTDVYFGSPVPPTTNTSSWYSNGTGCHLFVPYEHVNAYKTATNWTQLSSTLIGYAYAGTFTDGETLPLYDSDGYALTWYTDKAKTTIVTECPVDSPELYCIAGSKSAYVISGFADENTTLTITDTEGDTYNSLPVFVPYGRGITINAAPPIGGTNVTKVNSVAVAVPYTIASLDSDIVVISKSIEGTILQDTFENSSWETIKKVGYLGLADQYWNVGDTKSVTLLDESVHTIRISNLTGQTYDYADDTGSTSFILEFTDCIPPAGRMSAQSGTNTGGWPSCYVRTNFMPLILNNLPSDLSSSIATVNVKMWSSNDNKWVESFDKLFLPVEKEICMTQVFSNTSEWNAFTRWQYYNQHTESSYRIKKLQTTDYTWWLRTTYTSGYYAVVGSNGGTSSGYTTSNYGISPCFCI